MCGEAAPARWGARPLPDATEDELYDLGERLAVAAAVVQNGVLFALLLTFNAPLSTALFGEVRVLPMALELLLGTHGVLVFFLAYLFRRGLAISLFAPSPSGRREIPPQRLQRASMACLGLAILLPLFDGEPSPELPLAALTSPLSSPHLPASPRISPHLTASHRIPPHLAASHRISQAGSHDLPSSPHISRHLPASPLTSQAGSGGRPSAIFSTARSPRRCPSRTASTPAECSPRPSATIGGRCAALPSACARSSQRSWAGEIAQPPLSSPSLIPLSSSLIPLFHLPLSSPSSIFL